MGGVINTQFILYQGCTRDYHLFIIIIMEIKNKIVLVTGATGGIGTAITGVMRKEGAKLILHYNNGKPSGS